MDDPAFVIEHHRSIEDATLMFPVDKLDGADLSDAFIMRFNPYGQYVLPNRLVGIYGQVPIAHAFVTGEDTTAIGNVEFGAFLLPFHTSELILRGGFALGTAPDSGRGAFVNYTSAYERLTDFMLVAPQYTTLRLSGSTVQQSGMAFLRIDGGLDLALDKPRGGEGLNQRVDSLERSSYIQPYG
jgi:hypothetical protein